MTTRDEVTVTGSSLTIRDLTALVANTNVQIELSQDVRARTDEARAFLEKRMQVEVIYGVNTGFGPMASHLVGTDELTALQQNLVLSHAVGMGRSVPRAYVLAAMAVRLNTLARGRSGVTYNLLEQLRDAINNRLTPVVPEHGSVGASGDLVQLAHIALGLIGKGQVSFGDRRMSAAMAMEQCGMRPYQLKPKEGLSLINGTSFMSGVAALMCAETKRLLSFAARLGAWARELVGGFDDGIDERFHTFRPHPGQAAVARALRELSAESSMTKRRADLHARHAPTTRTHQIDENVQEVYSFRCIPQLLGPVLEGLSQAEAVVETELNAVTDNPVVDAERGRFWHGGHFHGEYVAMVSDQMRANIVKLTMLSERRLNFFLNQRTNGSLPPFLNLETPGLTLALQGLQFTATSTTAHSQSLAYPHRLHSIPTNGDNQDVVSMGSDSVLMSMKAVENAYFVLSIESLVLAQATDVLATQESLSPAARGLYEVIRAESATIREDRVLVDELDAVVRLARRHEAIPVKWAFLSSEELS